MSGGGGSLDIDNYCTVSLFISAMFESSAMAVSVVGLDALAITYLTLLQRIVYQADVTWQTHIWLNLSTCTDLLPVDSRRMLLAMSVPRS